ncbi:MULTISPECIES: hypothetical protein [Methylobacterium]|jgi:hypothetical protein|uniref:Uncharacterized protein n=2 Tax=Methylobacterium TaxID=407 RepID=A0A0C6FHB8_9HYPH|nr:MULTISPECIES: hypothetical protein [Methylobacterium]MBK3400789.1 hypothetical protein [Methylobacterium ajmalii]MBK3412734.1 hypothetical protein [Methylobacterium ajmalii]MBK3420601.1 hypothetical protein [Methylobacterium ajmalii]MBZ6416787.1 hypothetical protein [Methylobacterium sp.]SFF82192.1 hypothetical protein SAMN04487844_1534 [Methylobacterium sp. yr596]
MPAHPKPAFTPFADESGVQTLGDMTLENGTTRIALHGSLDFARDRESLERARALARTLAEIVAVLEGEADLPERAEEVRVATTEVKNPFG